MAQEWAYVPVEVLKGRDGHADALVEGLFRSEQALNPSLPVVAPVVGARVAAAKTRAPKTVSTKIN